MESTKQDFSESKSLVIKEEEKSSIKIYAEYLKDFVIKNYLPISLLVGVIFGALVPEPGVVLNHKATQYICVIGIFLYSGLFLRTSAIKEAVKAYKAVIWGIVSILCITSIVGGQLTLLLTFDKTYTVNRLNSSSSSSIGNSTEKIYSNGLGPQEFKFGLLVYFCMPCTISSGVVMVTQLGGNFVLALLLTVTANIAGVFTIPLFFKWFLATAADIDFDVLSLLLQLCLTLLVPIVVGKCLRFIKKLKDCITVPKHKLILKLISVTLLAMITWLKVSKSSKDGGLSRLTFVSTLFIIAWALAMHGLFLILNTVVSFILKLKTDQKKCIIILASQKTLAVAIPTITFLPEEFGDQGLMAIALVICHLSIILFDAVLIPIWLMCEKSYCLVNYDEIA